MFRRRRSAGLPLAALLENYLVRAEAIADGGGGNLWVIEPTVPAQLLPEFTEAVVLCLVEHGVPVDGYTVLEGTATARVVVLPAADGAGAELDAVGVGVGVDDRSAAPALPATLLRPAEVAPPAPRRPAEGGAPESADPVPGPAVPEPVEPSDAEVPASATGVLDRAYESRSAR